jgi:hypothetical protein
LTGGRTATIIGPMHGRAKAIETTGSCDEEFILLAARRLSTTTRNLLAFYSEAMQRIRFRFD